MIDIKEIESKITHMRNNEFGIFGVDFIIKRNNKPVRILGGTFNEILTKNGKLKAWIKHELNYNSHLELEIRFM